MWVELLRHINHKKLFDEAEKHKVLINPGNVYAVGDTQSLRLSYTYAKEEEMVYGIKILAKLIRNY